MMGAGRPRNAGGDGKNSITSRASRTRGGPASNAGAIDGGRPEWHSGKLPRRKALGADRVALTLYQDVQT